MRLVPAILANVALVISVFGFGSLLGRWFPSRFSTADRIAVSLLGGLAILGTSLFCIGQVWFTRASITLVLALGAVLAAVRVATMLRQRQQFFAGVAINAIPFAVVAAILLVTAVGGLAEPTGDMENDAVAYHYLGPRVWLRDGQIRPVPDEAQTAFPCVVETQYAALMLLGGDRSPGFFAVVSLASLLLLSAGFSLRLGAGAAGAWWAAALIAAMPAVYRGAYGGFVDVLYAALVLAAARIAFDAKTPAHFALAGLFCGAAAGTKYTGLIATVLIIVCVLAIARAARGHTVETKLKSLATLIGLTALIAAPFYLRNWFVLGSPIYPPPPFLHKFFPAKYLPVAAVLQYHAYILHRGVGLGRGVAALFLLPYNLTFHTANFHGAGGIGIAPLALAPIGLLAAWRQRFARVLCLLVLLLTLTWFFTDQESRFLIPVYVLLALFAVIGAQYVLQFGSRLAHTLTALVVAVSLAYGLYMIIPDRILDMHAAVSQRFESARRQREIPYLETFNYLNSDPTVSTVLILNPYAPAFYSEKRYIKPLGRWGEETLPDATNLSAVLSQCQSLRVSHVLAIDPEPGPLRLAQHFAGLTLVFQAAGQRVYRVNQPPPSLP